MQIMPKKKQKQNKTGKVQNNILCTQMLFHPLSLHVFTYSYKEIWRMITYILPILYQLLQVLERTVEPVRIMLPS